MLKFLFFHLLILTLLVASLICLRSGYVRQIVSKLTWRLTSTETIRLIRDGEKRGKGVCRWGGGRAGGEGDNDLYVTVAVCNITKRSNIVEQVC